jgi:hypothetical protein
LYALSPVFGIHRFHPGFTGQRGRVLCGIAAKPRQAGLISTMELPHQLKNMVNAKSGWLKLAETGRFSAQIARNPARKNTFKYCVFIIFAWYTD